MPYVSTKNTFSALASPLSSARQSSSPSVKPPSWKLAAFLFTVTPWLAANVALAQPASLNKATVIAPAKLSRPERSALTMLVEEIEKRTTLRLPVESAWNAGSSDPVIVVATRTDLAGMGLPGEALSSLPAPPDKAEGYAVHTKTVDGREVVSIIGRDERGMLYGIGYFLRQVAMRPGEIALPAALDFASAPKLRWRGHQLGYRPKTNSYDGWSVADWQQYIRDLAVFGANVIELVPPRSDDDATSPHFTLPPLRMMQAMSQLAADYGLECWIWYPALDKDYDDPKTLQKDRAEWTEVFRSLPKIDAVFIPGGDPGNTPPAVLMRIAELQAKDLRAAHPGAGMWVSPQGFTADWLKQWLGIVAQKPAWLTGVVYGPWNRISLPELRRQVPASYPLRLYPDITHTILCQFPVPDWDSALASTLGREPIAPRPRAMAAIARQQTPYANGIISYSEGCNDDVNKAVWSALSWNPDAEVGEVLRDYARYFISPDLEYDFARGLSSLEKNWHGVLRSNEGVDDTLRLLQGMERTAPPRTLHNWRFQQALYRAYFDAYVRRRLIAETAAEQSALGIVENAPKTGSLAAMDAAARALARTPSDPTLLAWRTRIFQLAEALFQTIKMQLSVPLYQALAVPRGANLDTVDLSLNDRGWLLSRFGEIRALPTEAARLSALRQVTEWKNPGPGGYYDDLGNLEDEPHLVASGSPSDDPEFRVNALATHTVRTGTGLENWRASWWDQRSCFYGSSVEMRYTGLDPGARYRLRIVYIPSFRPSEIRLMANGTLQIHPPLDVGKEDRGKLPHPREFELPGEATQGGALDLRWTVNPDAGYLAGFGQIAEVWLERRPRGPGL